MKSHAARTYIVITAHVFVYPIKVGTCRVTDRERVQRWEENTFFKLAVMCLLVQIPPFPRTTPRGGLHCGEKNCNVPPAR